MLTDFALFTTMDTPCKQLIDPEESSTVQQAWPQPRPNELHFVLCEEDKVLVASLEVGLGACVSHQKVGLHCSCQEYLSLEMVRGMGHEFAMDWWVLGIMLYGYMPFKGATRKETFCNFLV
jgi:hypothetical protein